MEQIVRRDGVLYYGKRRCNSASDAYRLFQEDHDRAVVRAAYNKLGRLGQRKERIHGFGFVRPWDDEVPGEEFLSLGQVPYRIMGILGISYCRIVGIWDIPPMSEEKFERWFEWAFTKDSGGLVLRGRKEGFGRRKLEKKG